MDLNDLAHKVFGGPAQSAIPASAQQTTAIGTAAGDSAGGMVPVYLDAKVYTDERNPDDTQAIMVPTTQDAREGDSVIVGIDGTGHSVVTGVIGSGDRTKADVKTVADSLAETDSKLATVRSDADAHEQEIAKVKQDIADYKATATATYATKTEVDSKTGAITKTLTADYTKTSDMESAISAAKTEATAAANSNTANVLQKYTSTADMETRIASAQESAVASANGNTANVIKDYAKVTLMQSAIADAQSAAEKTAAASTDSKLADYTKTADLASTDAVKDAKSAGTTAQSQLADYKGTVSETYAEKTELVESVNQLSSTMTSQYTAFTDYRKTNDTVLSKVQTDATNAQSTIDSYKTANDKAVADAKSAGTTAQNQLNTYKSSNDAAVADAKSAGMTAQSKLDSYKTATDQRLDELKNIADNAIESFYLKGAPSATNPPASTWTTDALKKQHAGDLYMDTDTGYSYRWSGTEWVQVKDSDVTKALKEIESVKTTYVTKSELKATDTELSGKVSDALTTAKSYTDGSVEKEATARDAAIKAQADSISLSVSKTYTKYETFSAYQTDADGRIATANSNASTAVSTAKTAASDAATAKTNASTAVTTANGAASTASSAKSVADSASNTAKAASTSASNAVSTANAANSTAQTANTTAQTAKTTADDAYSRTLRVQISSSPADATGDTSALTATVWRGGQQLTEQEVAMMGLIKWYVGDSCKSTGWTYTCAAGTAVECRLEG